METDREAAEDLTSQISGTCVYLCLFTSYLEHNRCSCRV